MARIKSVPRRNARGRFTTFMARSKKAARKRVVPMEGAFKAPLAPGSKKQSNALVNIAKRLAREGSLQSGKADRLQGKLPLYVADRAGGQISEIATAGFYAVPPEANTI